MIALQSSKSAVTLNTHSTTKSRPIPPMPPVPPPHAATIPTSTASIPLTSTRSIPPEFKRRSSCSSENNARHGPNAKSLTTQRSFPHLSTKKSWRRRGSDTSCKSTVSSAATTFIGNTTSSDSDVMVKPTTSMGSGPTTQSNGRNTESTMFLTTSGDQIRYASRKRNRDFHSIFDGISEEERLIDDYGCALQREILAQGKMYISENHLCFYANIFGWVTNLVIDFKDIDSIEKKSTAIFVPNAICITTGSTKYFFGSFISRDQAYDLLTNLRENAQMKYNTAKEANQCKKVDSATTLAETVLDDNSDESGYTSSSDYTDSSEYEFGENDSLLAANDHANMKDFEQHAVSTLKATETQMPLSMSMTVNDAAAARQRALSETNDRRPSLKDSIRMTSEKYLPKAARITTKNTTTTVKAASSSNINNANAATTVTPSVKALSDTALHKTSNSTQQIKSSTECECGINNEHFPNVVLDTKYNTDIETLYNILFVSDFMQDFLNCNQKLSEVCIGDWSSGSDCAKIRQTSYVKPLVNTMGIGPKQTRCLLTEKIQHHDATDYVSQLSVCRTPDVPSGGSFSIKTRTCLSWCAQGQVRVLVTVSVEFTKTCWIKTTVEKACIDGQQKFYTELDLAIKDHLIKLAPASLDGLEQQETTLMKGKRKGSRRRQQQKRKHSDTSASSSPQQSSNTNRLSRMTTTTAIKQQPEKSIASRIISSTIHWLLNKDITIPPQIYVIILLMVVLCQLYTGAMMASISKQISHRCNTVQMPGANSPPSYVLQQHSFSPLFAQQLQNDETSELD